MPTCKICKHKYTPKFRTTEPCPNIECRMELYKKAHKKVVSENKAAAGVVIKDLRAKTKTRYDWAKELQSVINSIVRELDKGRVCISSLKPLNPKFDAGHRFSRGGFSNLSFNLLNIFAQSVHDNQYKSGNPDGYDNGLKTIYGNDLLNEVHSLKQKHHGLIIDTEMIKTALPMAKSILKAMKAENKAYCPTERIMKRKQFNKMIGIYE